MIYVAFTLGLLGSLHCLGMCGPLAIAFCTKPNSSKLETIYHALSYNLGRTAMYIVLGVLFGTLGSFVVLADIQQLISIALGVTLIATFAFSIDIDKSINSQTQIAKLYTYIRNLLSRMMARADKYPPFLLGMGNGLLPCGLVYLALAGAIASGSIQGGMLFMGFFGLGTIPMLLGVVMGIHMVSFKIQKKFRTLLPYVTLAFGVFLIYRGVMVEMPMELDFWEALKNPVMCH